VQLKTDRFHSIISDCSLKDSSGAIDLYLHDHWLSDPLGERAHVFLAIEWRENQCQRPPNLSLARWTYHPLIQTRHQFYPPDRTLGAPCSHRQRSAAGGRIHRDAIQSRCLAVLSPPRLHVSIAQQGGAYEYPSHRNPDFFSLAHICCRLPHPFGLNHLCAGSSELCLQGWSAVEGVHSAPCLSVASAGWLPSKIDRSTVNL
jgi:hypothetical protein